MTSVAAGDTGRRPGRPRDERVDRAIVDAALELFAAEGYDALSVESVALQAEVSKATIYRRWPGKRELVVDALATLNDDFPPLTDGSTKERLLTAMKYMANKHADSLAGRIMPSMLVYSVSQPDLYAEYFDRVIMPRRRRLQVVLRDGIENGDLRPDLDIETATMSIVGPVLLQVHSLGRRTPNPDLPDQLMDILWPGLAATAGKSDSRA